MSNRKGLWTWRCCVLVALGTLLAAAPAAAQFDRAQLSGRIKDAQAAAVPGATVTATNRQTQTASVAVSDSTGFFTFPNLAAGHYDVSAELQGFKKSMRQDIGLDAAGSLTLDFTLETGAVTEEVTVTAEARTGPSRPPSADRGNARRRTRSAGTARAHRA